MEEEEDHPIPSYTFSVICSSKPTICRVLISSSHLTACFGLSLFPESTKLGTIQCRIVHGSTLTNLQVATLYSSNSILYINTSEKLRDEMAIPFTDYLHSENWLSGEITAVFSISESEFVGRPGSRVRCVCAAAADCTGLQGLEPGNVVKGVSAAVLTTSEAYQLNGKCVVGITESYELCGENLMAFAVIAQQYGLHSNVDAAIRRVEQEKFKHQIYS